MNELVERILFDKGYWSYARHILLWTFLYMDELLYTFLSAEGKEDLDIFLISILLDIIMVYVNLYYLIPKFLQKGKYILYLLLSAATVIINVIIMYNYNSTIFEMELALDDFVSWFITNATLLATAVAIKIGKYSYEQKRFTEQLKLDQSKLELNYLKQQVNPHFLFNVLNTIHIQSISNPAAVSETVIQLSDLLRYQIYDAGKADKVALSRDIEFLKNYSALEEIRRNNLKVSWVMNAKMPRIRITPFLFLPLIENAFKHSRSLNETPSSIYIAWSYQNNTLELKVENTIGNTTEENNDGFGIDTLKKRLELLYPNNYKLELGIKNSKFISILQLNIDEGGNY